MLAGSSPRIRENTEAILGFLLRGASASKPTTLSFPRASAGRDEMQSDATARGSEPGDRRGPQILTGGQPASPYAERQILIASVAPHCVPW
jgi:hypothetical protein